MNALSSTIATGNCFCNGHCHAAEPMRLMREGQAEKAFGAARDAVLKAPNCAHTHGVLASLMNNNGNAEIAEKHIGISSVLGNPPGQVNSMMGYSMIAQGKLEVAENFFHQAMIANPNNMQAHAGLMKVFELRRDYERAKEFADNLYASAPDMPGLRLTYSRVLQGLGQLGAAMDVLVGSNDCMCFYELGKLEEKEGNYSKAFESYLYANKISGKVYDEATAAMRISNHKEFTTKTNMSKMPKIDCIGDSFTPLFITGYPRSGTTLIETLLSNHPRVCAGDEMNYIHHIAGMTRSWLGSSVDYPGALNEFVIGDKDAVLSAFQTYYMTKARQRNHKLSMYLTDKMPLNEMHLPLISMIFANAPILYVRRHPMDIVFSNFSNYLTHGFNQSFSLETSALHYARVDDLLSHFKKKVDMNFAEIRYEDVISSPEKEMRELLEFIGLKYDPACIASETSVNHPRTPSYEAVKKPINDSAIGRWKNFEQFMSADVLSTIEPIITREGY